MRYTPKQLRIGINNAEQVIWHYAQYDRTTPYQDAIIQLNIRRIRRLENMLWATKGNLYLYNQ